ncbi:MAG TPA: SgcJ/EcaC family oxidoreductase [Acidobacteriaceae bacterium]|nr:SgcJ/EcaC family oxidoreductase [Acidobacteriaceae bacterium]
MRLFFALSVALLLAPYGVRAQGTTEDAAIRRVLARETDGWNSFNAKQVVSTFTDDAIWQNPFGVRIHGAKEMEKFLTDLLARPGYRAGTSTTPRTVLDVRLTSPTTAVAWSDERIQGLVNDLSGNPMPPRHSYYLEALVKKDGVWKISDAMVMDIIHPK